jgi:hypothetical protein
MMDILTAKGQISVKDERRAVEIFHSNYPQFRYLHTPKDSPAIIDALIVKDDVLYSAVETKCRDMSVDEFYGRFKGQWLVTYEKVEKARQMAISLGLGLTGFLYLKQSDTLLIKQIVSPDGLFCQKLHIEATETQRTINGGLAVRNNAYIDMNGATRLVI